MSGIRILLKNGQSIDFFGANIEEFYKVFANQEGSIIAMRDDNKIKLVLLWSEVMGAVELEGFSEDVDHHRSVGKRIKEMDKKFQERRERKRIWE